MLCSVWQLGEFKTYIERRGKVLNFTKSRRGKAVKAKSQFQSHEWKKNVGKSSMIYS